MHMRNSIMIQIVALLLTSSSPAWSQFGKSVFVTRDPRVDVLVDKQIELNGEAIKGRTITTKGKRKSQFTKRGKYEGYRSTRKRAIVTLAKDNKIDLFETTT